MEMKIESTWATKLVSKLITRSVRKKLGKDVSIQVNAVTLNQAEDGKMKLHIDMDGYVTKEDLAALLLS